MTAPRSRRYQEFLARLEREGRAASEGFIRELSREVEVPAVGPVRVELVRPDVENRSAAKAKGGHPRDQYPREEVVRVLRAWRDREGAPQKVSARSLARPGFSRKAVRRVIRLDDHGAFQLGPRGGLKRRGTNGEFRATRKFVSLRELEEALGLGSLG